MRNMIADQRVSRELRSSGWVVRDHQQHQVQPLICLVAGIPAAELRNFPEHVESVRPGVLHITRVSVKPSSHGVKSSIDRMFVAGVSPFDQYAQHARQFQFCRRPLPYPPSEYPQVRARKLSPSNQTKDTLEAIDGVRAGHADFVNNLRMRRFDRVQPLVYGSTKESSTVGQESVQVPTDEPGIFGTVNGVHNPAEQNARLVQPPDLLAEVGRCTS